MNKLNIVLATVVMAFGFGCFYLLQNLRTEQARADHLQRRRRGARFKCGMMR